MHTRLMFYKKASITFKRTMLFRYCLLNVMNPVFKIPVLKMLRVFCKNKCYCETVPIPLATIKRENITALISNQHSYTFTWYKRYASREHFCYTWWEASYLYTGSWHTRDVKLHLRSRWVTCGGASRHARCR